MKSVTTILAKVPNTRSSFLNKNSFTCSRNVVTPIHVDTLENVLNEHLDPSFVLKLCSELRFGTRVGYEGLRIPKVSEILKSAIENPAIVSSNLDRKVALGHTAGRFTSLPFANF